MKIIKHFSLALALTGMLGACSEDESLNPQSDGSKLEVRLQGEIDQLAASRVNDNGFADKDVVGIYVVDFENGNPGKLQVGNNNTSNMRLTYHENENKWKGTGSIFWKDDHTPIDVYGYYPYATEVKNVDKFPFIIQTNQPANVQNKQITGYEMSDFLWAKTAGVAPTPAPIMLHYKHIMAGVKVSLVMGKGFDAAQWNALKKMVMVENVYCRTFVNLATGEVTLDQSVKPEGVVACGSGNDFRAIIAPQTVAAKTSLLSITLDGETYKFTRDNAMTYLPGKNHKFTLEVNKRLPGGDYELKLISEAISPWEADPESHNGVLREYVTINVPQAGQLQEIVKQKGIDPSLMKNLKLTGELTESDFEFIRTYMPYLSALNLKEVKLRNCRLHFNRPEPGEDDVIPYHACKYMKALKYVVLPDHFKKIGDEAFRYTVLTGSLIIPEGVTEIGGSAFDNSHEDVILNNLSGELRLPSTLKVIGGNAFINCDFTGELRLPEGLKEIRGGAFVNCKYFTGSLNFPSSIEIIESAFWGMDGITGHVTIPEVMIHDPGGFGPNISSVTFPSKTETINSWQAIVGLKGDLYLPPTVREIGAETFAHQKIHHVNLPDKLEKISQSAFNDCDLRDTVKFPPLINVISSGVLGGNGKLDAILLPAGVEVIEDWAFAGCHSLTYLRCLAKDPPEVRNLNAFDGIAKNNFTIEVPEGSVAAYRNAPVWREFKRIATYKNFVCRPTMAKLLNRGGTRDMILNADGPWKMIHCPSWCHIDKTSGDKKTQIKVTIDNMAHNAGNRRDSIVFQLNDSEQRTTYMTVAQYDYEREEDEPVQLQKATKGKGVNLYIVGDGYDAADIAAGTYLQDMQQELEYFFGVEPYTTYKDYFNVYTSIALSYESGIGTLNTLRNVKFGTQYGDFSPGSRIMGDSDAVLNYAVQTVPEITQEEAIHRLLAIVVPNSTYYDGQTVMYGSGSAVAFCPKSELPYPNDARGLIQHEAGGHGFGKLGDEYVYHMAYIQKCACNCCGHVNELKAYKEIGWYPNLSLDGKYRDHEWKQLIFDPKYSDKVDIFEGGYFHSWGVYRPEWNSCMNNNIPYFNAPSRMAIVKRILDFAGEPFTFEKFKANDKDTMGKDFLDTRSPAAREEGAMHPRKPIFIKGSPKI